MIQIYGTPTCTYCSKAKALLDSRNIEYKYFSIGEDVSKSEVLEIIPEGWKTVPIILNNNSFIGGYDQLAQLIEETSGGTDDF